MERRFVAAAVALAATAIALLTGCASTGSSSGSTPTTPTAGSVGSAARPENSRSMDDGFPTGLGVESEAVLVEALGIYHMERTDAECVAHQAFVDELPDRTYVMPTRSPPRS